MFGSDFLDVGIGVALLFLFVSLICTAVIEGIEARLKTRAKDLELGIIELLQAESQPDLVKKFYESPLIYSLFSGEYKKGSRGLPSYIPSANFAGALLDMIINGDLANAPHQAPGAARPELTVAALRSAAGNIANEKLRRAVFAALDGAKDDINAVKVNLGAWFDGTMDRVSGWYKRRTQAILFVIGLVTAVGLNIDAIAVVKALSTDKALRESAVAQAEAIVGPAVVAQTGGTQAAEQARSDALLALQKLSYGELSTRLEEIGYPIGWPGPQGRKCEVLTDPSGPADAKPAGADTADAGADTAGADTAGADTAGAGAAATAGADTAGAGAAPAGAANADASSGGAANANAAGADAAKARFECWNERTLWTNVQMGIGWLATAFAVMLGAPFWFDLLNKFMVIRSTVKPREKSQEEGSEDRAQSGTGSAPSASRGGGSPSGTAAGSAQAENAPNQWKDGVEEGVI